MALARSLSAGNAAPSERVRAGFVGVGGRAGRLLQYFSEQSDVEIVALAEIDQRRIPTAMSLLAERQDKVSTLTWNRLATPPRSCATWPTSPGA